ncbi:AAEL004411-PA [Aedes aegypti]|uniref:AAEL004411-PA n=1 Tax=Aedes aegypti TaxID=7159 RepID=Q17CW1_AEDAE|nr:AAEL004411-PA [Aedes aegypti]
MDAVKKLTQFVPNKVLFGLALCTIFCTLVYIPANGMPFPSKKGRYSPSFAIFGYA